VPPTTEADFFTAHALADHAAFAANRNNSPYGAAKAAIAGFTRQISLEALPEVRVNCVAPGRTITGMTSPLMVARGHDMVEGEKIFAQPVPMGRMARPEELAATICFFLSEFNQNFYVKLLFIILFILVFNSFIVYYSIANSQVLRMLDLFLPSVEISPLPRRMNSPRPIWLAAIAKVFAETVALLNLESEPSSRSGFAA
jgi:hypothetical protein